MSQINTYQYSVKENIRPIGELSCRTRIFNSFLIRSLSFFSDHSKGSHGIPGLYFKYDMSALKVIVEQDRENFIHFLVRLSSVIAGIIVISSYLISLSRLLVGMCFKTTQQALPKLINEKTVNILPQQPNHIIANANKMTDTDFKFTVQ